MEEEDLVEVLCRIAEMVIHMKGIQIEVVFEGRVVLVLEVRNMFSWEVLQLDEYNLEEETAEEANN